MVIGCTSRVREIGEAGMESHGDERKFNGCSYFWNDLSYLEKITTLLQPTPQKTWGQNPSNANKSHMGNLEFHLYRP